MLVFYKIYINLYIIGGKKMKIYKIKNELDYEIYIIASEINNAVKCFEERAERDEQNPNIKEIKFIGYCIIGK